MEASKLTQLSSTMKKLGNSFVNAFAHSEPQLSPLTEQIPLFQDLDMKSEGSEVVEEWVFVGQDHLGRQFFVDYNNSERIRIDEEIILTW